MGTGTPGNHPQIVLQPDILVSCPALAIGSASHLVIEPIDRLQVPDIEEQGDRALDANLCGRFSAVPLLGFARDSPAPNCDKRREGIRIEIAAQRCAYATACRHGGRVRRMDAAA